MKIAELIPGASGSLRRRIRAKVVKPHGRSGCWLWTGAKSKKRDGALRPVIRAGGKGSRLLLVARVVLALKDRVSLTLRAGLEAGHICHNHGCVNPRHLMWQTRLENEEAKHEYDAYCDFAAAVDDLAEQEAAC
jgi:hypothetical protein